MSFRRTNGRPCVRFATRLSNGRLKAHLVESLVALGLVVINDGVPAMTPTGRKVLVRGSCRLLDLVA
ncbi:hypothetical protein ACVIHB_001565 [Bradyrhizobium liaoningense]